MKPYIQKFLVVLLFVLGHFSQAQAGIFKYLSEYQLGVDYTNSQDSLLLTYETATTSEGVNSDQCEANEDDSSVMDCHASVFRGTGDGWGVVLEKPFDRRGFWHYDWGIDGSVRWLRGELNKKERDKQSAAALPLKKMTYELAAFVLKPRLRFGIAPSRKWPDILISIGPAVQAAVGEVGINQQKKTVGVGSTSTSNALAIFRGFLKLELVLWRFGDGAFSLFSESDWSGGGGSTGFYPGEVDGMSNFRASFSSSTGGAIYGLGAKLLLDWP